MASKIVFDLFAYIFVYFSFSLFLTSNFKSLANNPLVVLILLASVLISSLITRQYSGENNKKFYDYAKQLLLTTSILLMIITLLISLIRITIPEIRILLLGTIVLVFSIKLFLLLFDNIFKEKKVELLTNFSPLILISEFLLIGAIIFYAYLIEGKGLNKDADKIAIGIFTVLWFVVGLFVHGFHKLSAYDNFWRYIWTHVKSNLLLIVFVTTIFLFLEPVINITAYSYCINYVFAIASIILNAFLFIIFKKPGEDIIKYKLLRASEIYDEPLVKYVERKEGKYAPEENPYNPYFYDELSNIYLKKFPDILEFVNDTLDLFRVDFRKAVVHRSSDTYNVEVLPEETIELYMNLHEINDMRRINSYLIHVNKKLIDGGVFVSCVEPINLRRKKFMEKFPYYLAIVFYFLDFIINRVIPKLPVCKQVYFSLTKGKRRVISLSETLGRLYYCGFEVINLRTIGTKVYFAAKKIKYPLSDESPSYGPLIKLKRVGKGGKIIKVYKFRTMYPYSEYLQRFIYEVTNLQEGGKFKNDFRITSWGKVLRKLWLDELPMLINFFRGELKIVGVRPLSLHYFYLYNEELRNRRINYKPGLFPPFYYDMPKTLDEIMESEIKYLDSYDLHPIWTDIKYFCVIAYNIIFNKARSA
ncbi:sugar transferase [Melioribacter sp. OK-6-Me]|uniref:sugar transferase n=1 Tax=Melioribacter sp. OK-6-Me TaxID=3423433 RepID=UPI003ED8B523